MLRPPQDDLLDALFQALSAMALPLQEGDILFFSAKAVAIYQGRCVKVQTTAEREALIAQEADYYIENQFLANPLPFTLKNRTPVPFAGIDQSNGNGWHILWPEQPQETALALRRQLCLHYQLKQLGVVIADSTLFPLRRGCIGISIASAGLQLLHNYRGQKDLFGRELQLSENNIVDRLTSFATLFMGEGAEQTPVAILRGLSQYTTDQAADDYQQLFIDPKKDFYRPLFGDLL